MENVAVDDRRGEPRSGGETLPAAFLVSAPGLRVLDVVDASASGIRLRTMVPLRPGRTIALKRRQDEHGPEQSFVAIVLRCWVQSLARSGVIFEAALSLAPPANTPGGA